MSVLTDIRSGLLKYATGVFINESPVTVTLERKTMVTKPGGGQDKVDSLLDPQTFRLINQTASDGTATSETDRGTVHRYNYMLLGAFDADVQIDDTWTEGSAQYHVDGLLPNNGFETRATVTAFSSEPIHG